MPDVAAMIARAAPLWLIACVVAAVAAILALLYVAFRWAIRRVAAAAFDPKERAPIFMAGVVDGRPVHGAAARQAFRDRARVRDPGAGDLRAAGCG